MKYLELKTKDPYFNLAVEEYLFDNSTEDVFMLWQNEPTVVIGRNQNVYAEVRLDEAGKNGVHIARRITGGGAVYHDGGNLNYTFISVNSQGGIDFERFTSPVISALRSLGVDAKLGGRNDIEVSGRKISGNAQCKRGNRVLHHGTLLFDSNLEFLSGILSVDEEKIKSKAIKSTRSRVANLKELLPSLSNVDEFISLISEYVIRELSAERSTLTVTPEIERLRERNASDDWLFPSEGYLSSYSIKKKKRYPFGVVEVYLDMSNDVIKGAKICGDFFGNGDISELEALLSGKRLAELSDVFSTFNINEYIFGMSIEEFLLHILA